MRVCVTTIIVLPFYLITADKYRIVVVLSIAENTMMPKTAVTLAFKTGIYKKIK